MNQTDAPHVQQCPDCDAAPDLEPVMSRRDLLRAAGAVAVTAAAAALPSARAFALPKPAAPPAGVPESAVKALYDTLAPGQREKVVLAWSDPLRHKVDNNWAIVKPAIHEVFDRDQTELVKSVLRGVTNEEWYPKILAQMKTDDNGLENYHVAIFRDDASGRLEWVLTGRHATIRCGGDPRDNMAFGGPIFYGHAPKFNEDPGHPGNIFWYQGKRANEVFQMLDGKQRGEALVALAPDENAIQFRKPGQPLPGIPISELSSDQKLHVRMVMADILAPYRKADVDDVLSDVQANGGLDALHLAFYKQPSLGQDGVWDIWRLEGPDFVWHFRGAPHVHTWVNIARKA